MAFPFSHLTPQENEQLRSAIANITILIAGADGKIDIDETSWAAKIAKIRTYNSNDEMLPYYTSVGMDFNEQVNQLIRDLPTNTAERQQILTGRLEALNGILAKLPQKIASLYYRDFVSFAHHVAKASGGFLGFFQIGPNETRWMDLPMIQPVHYHDEEE